MADAVEALIAAVYLDNLNSDGENIIHRMVMDWYKDLIQEVGQEQVLKDAKSRLQELLQGNRLPLPTYELIQTLGSAPNQVFVVRCHCTVVGVDPIIETGASRRIAEQKCAERMINQLNKLLPNS